jgi:hypothetical protein
MSAVVTISQHFPVQSKDREYHGGPQPTVRPREVPRAEMRRFIEETLDDVERSQCPFWVCPGPDKPTRGMLTCVVCYRIKRLRVMLGWLAEDTTDHIARARGLVRGGGSA